MLNIVNFTKNTKRTFDLFRPILRPFCSQPSTDGEKKLYQILKSKLPKAELIIVEDISGGCGSMYQIKIISEDFRGKPLVAQHRMVSDILKEDVKAMHGLRIFTQVPPPKNS